VVNGVVTYSVKVGLPTSEDRLKPGMTANTQIVLEQRDNVVLVPTWAIRKDKKSGKSFITVADETDPEKQKTKEIEVVLGLKDEATAEVISGASEGTVVLQPQTVNGG
jgi:HlyD family secretion protein